MPAKLSPPSNSSYSRGAAPTTSSELPPVSFNSSSNGLTKQFSKSSMARGSSLRVGKVITEARAQLTPEKPVHHYDSSSSRPTSLATLTNRFIDEGEQRVQQEMIDMLTAKLAKKEKECELLRRQHSGVEEMRHEFEMHVACLESELKQTRMETASKGEQLQRDAQHAMLQAERFREEAEAQRVALQEMRRQRERDAEMARGKEQQLQRQQEELRRELAMTQGERKNLDARVSSLQEQLSDEISLGKALQARCDELEAAVTRGQKLIEELTHELEDSRSCAAEFDAKCVQLESEKHALEDKLQQLSRSLKDVHTRVNDAERRKSDLTQAETQMSKQLTQLHRENEELKARNGQLMAQNKQQQMRVTNLESGKAAMDAKHKEASEEIEQARKRCREYQFRIKQLQEEVTYMTKKKPAASAAEPQHAPPVVSTPARQKPMVTPATEDGVPSWMRD